MKKWTLATLVLSLFSAQAFAGEQASFMVTGRDLTEESFYGYGLETPDFFSGAFPNNVNPTRVLTPRVPGGWSFGLTGAYLEPFDSQLDYAIIDPAAVILSSPSTASVIHQVDPGSRFAFGGFIGYTFPYSGLDLTLDGIFFPEVTDNDLVVADGNTLFTVLNPMSVRAAAAATSVKHQAYFINLDMGYTIYGGSRFQLHPFSGIGFGRFSRNVDTTYTDAVITNITAPPPTLPVGTAFVNQGSSFSGIGPRIGIDLKYMFLPCISLKGELASEILVGEINTDFTATISEPPTTIPVTHFFHVHEGSTERVVPELEAKLGLVYTHPFCRGGKLAIEVGYQINHFFDAFNSFRDAGETTPVATAPPTVDGGFLILAKNVHGFDLFGPYLTVSVLDMACPTDMVVPPFEVNVPRLPGGFEIGVEAIWAESQSNYLEYASLNSTTDNDGQLFRINPKPKYGYALHVGYIFPDTANDIMGNYLHINNSASTSEIPPAGQFLNEILVSPNILNLAFPPPILATSARASYNETFQAADIEVGQHINAGDLNIRLWAGAGFINIDGKLSAVYNLPFTPPGSTIPNTVFEESSFSGFGPRIGAEFNYLFSDNFELVSRIGTGLYFGDHDSSYLNEQPLDTTRPLTFIDTGTHFNHKSFVPNIDLQVGLAYQLGFWRTRWIVELGYQANHYFNALNTLQRDNLVTGNFLNEVHDLDLNGPYLSLTLANIGACEPGCNVPAPYPVIAPELIGGLELAIEYLSFKVRANNLEYAIVDPSPVTLVFPVPSEDSFIQAIDPRNHSGYEVHAAYQFPLTANDIAANYTYISSKKSESITAPAGGVLWTLLSRGSTTNAAFPFIASAADADMDFGLHDFDVEFGRYLKFMCLDLRTFIGVAFEHISENLNVTYLNGLTFETLTTPPGTVIPSDTVQQSNTFRGIGPRIGFEGKLNLPYGFGLVGDAATTLLVGKLDSELLEFDTAINTRTGATFAFNTALHPTPSRRRIVPVMDLKFGLAYTLPLNCSEVRLEVGYELEQYFKLLDVFRFTSPINADFIKFEQDLSLDGPYAKLQVRF